MSANAIRARFAALCIAMALLGPAMANGGDAQPAAPLLASAGESAPPEAAEAPADDPLCASCPGLGISAQGLSLHTSPRAHGKSWNQENPGLGARLILTGDWSLQAGEYKNSISRRSCYALADWTPWTPFPSQPSLRLGLYGGAVTGYPEAKVQAGGGPLARLSLGRASLALRYLPKAPGGASAAFSLEGAVNF